MRKICLFLVLCLLLTGCSTQTIPEDSQNTTGVHTGIDPTGEGPALDATGDISGGGNSNGGTSSGGTSNGGTSNGGTSNGGTSNGGTSNGEVLPDSCKSGHLDEANDGFCDRCSKFLLVIVDFYTVNDLHGKLDDGDTHPGVDELSTYLENARQSDDHMLLLSAGDMWQGSSESNLTQGQIMTEWMNEMDFDAMTLGNHEYDWGKTPIEANHALAQFPFLAINVYDRATNNRVAYCDSSALVDLGSVQIGLIGAMGDCYSSIASDKTQDIYFKTGSDLTALVKAESKKLRQQGADYIVYLIHDGYDRSKGNTPTPVGSGQISSYYDTGLSDGYVDLVFEGHTHQKYILKDEHGVHHLQNGGDNKGISHVEIAINTANSKSTLRQTELVATSEYTSLSDHPVVDKLLDKYANTIGVGSQVLGTNSKKRGSSELCQLVADLYYKEGEKRWGKDYDIVLGGGFISARSPYNLYQGDIAYGDLYNIFPFDNQLVLCSIKGRDLKEKFFETDNDRYYVGYGDYGRQVKNRLKNNQDLDKTFYIVVDSYTSPYPYNRLTEITRLDEAVYARDLLAEYAKSGGFNNY